MTLTHSAGATGLSFEQIGKAIGKDEVWVAAAFYAQVRRLLTLPFPQLYSLSPTVLERTCAYVFTCLLASWTIKAKLTAEQIGELAKAHEIPSQSVHDQLGAHWWPNRGLGQSPPADPVIYRLYEGVMVYGQPIKVCRTINTNDLGDCCSSMHANRRCSMRK